MKVEICIDNIESAKLLIPYSPRIDRIELCSSLALDGLSPSPSLVHFCRENLPDIQRHVMIRPRAGDFIYENDYAKVMLDEISMFHKIGIHGIVFGALTIESEIDYEKTKLITEEAKRLN